ncbi:MAG: hypothetical protein OXD44_00255 [Gammaproteobacteria bacterium]|nr:hypothetical protein [Gammaproteobacteria bacterium]MCY4227828.1 hypothetical protein [Gammaproteobacteria bacterium]MCY4312133.1 hypothetical protein [Gammaproteobacteria bacterium]
MNEKKKRSSRSRYSEHFERLDATPEQAARTIMHSKPRRPDEWKYLKKEKERG